MVLVSLCCLFVFLGMFIGKKWNLKSVSINTIFGMFLINCFVVLLPNAYSILHINYHFTTIIYLCLGIIIGYLFMNVVSYKYDNCDNISIVGFSILNSYLLYVSKINLLLFIVNVIYYIIIGIYIRDSKSWIFVIVGNVLGLLLSLFSGFGIGYVFCLMIGFVFYFIISVCSLIFRSNCVKDYLGLIFGIIIALIGGLL